jgi:hypothetical protein
MRGERKEDGVDKKQRQKEENKHEGEGGGGSRKGMGKQKHLRINEAMVLVAIVRPRRLRGNEKVLTPIRFAATLIPLPKMSLLGLNIDGFAERVLT